LLIIAEQDKDNITWYLHQI